MDYKEMASMSEELKKLADKYNITVVTAKAPPPVGRSHKRPRVIVLDSFCQAR
jgi:hypothetical protein